MDEGGAVGNLVRRFGRCILPALLLVMGVWNSPAQAVSRPNLVFILADDLDQLSMWALPTVLDIAARGTSFARAYVSSPLCAPSRATILTGRYTQNTGVRRNKPPYGGFESFYASDLERTAIPVQLQRAGYRTGLVGKYINQFPNRASPGYIPPGWDYWVSPKGGNYMYSWSDYYLNENGRIVFYGAGPGTYATDVYGLRAREFVEGAVNDGQPFALFFWPSAPHTPEVPAPRHTELYPAAKLPVTEVSPEWYVGDKPSFLRFPPPPGEVLLAANLSYRKRLQMLASLDEAIAALRRRLEALGQLDNTYIVFTSDNGWHHAFHNLRPWKGTAFEEDIRVPLIVAGPGVPRGRTIHRLVSNADLAPTFAAWTGAQQPPQVDGRSLAGLIAATRPDLVPWRKRVPFYRLTETVPGPVATFTHHARRTGAGSTAGYACLDQIPDWTPVGIDPVNLPEFRGVRSDRYTYVEYVTGDLELYDRLTHPRQQHNSVCQASAGLLADLHEHAQALATCAGAACRALEDR